MTREEAEKIARRLEMLAIRLEKSVQIPKTPHGDGLLRVHGKQFVNCLMKLHEFAKEYRDA